MILRPAGQYDVPQIVRSAVEFAAVAYPDDVCEPGHIAGVTMKAIDEAFAAVMETDGHEYAGCFLGCAGPNALTGKKAMIEILFVVEPRFRGHGRKLLAYAEEWAREQGCESATLSHPEGQARAGKVFEAWGYVPSERWLRKVL